MDELRNLVSQQPPDRNLFGIHIAFGHFDALVKDLDSLMDDGEFIVFIYYNIYAIYDICLFTDLIDWSKIEHFLSHLLGIVNVYSRFIIKSVVLSLCFN